MWAWTWNWLWTYLSFCNVRIPNPYIFYRHNTVKSQISNLHFIEATNAYSIKILYTVKNVVALTHNPHLRQRFSRKLQKEGFIKLVSKDHRSFSLNL